VDDVNVADATQIEAVRDFNRFYTARMGLTKGRYLGTGHPLAEARVLYELGQGTTETAQLKTRLDIDPGQLSRLITRLESQGLLEKRTNGRAQQLELTEQGRATYERLNARSAEEIGRILDGLRDAHEVVQAMRELKTAIEPDDTLLIRGLEPGDLGWLVERHGVVYAREYGWDQSFERLVAQIAADFDPQQDRAWIAEHNGKRAGAVLCVHHDERMAKLRTLLVEPHARGLGLGTRLVEEVIKHARSRGYETITLWTNDVLHAARRIYERKGFTLQHEAPHHAFGHDLVEQTWSLTLKPWTETR
jgi:GNAT superfamily N-acetyltransferase/DNA-binding MarR family transcriptional regulator